MWFRIAKTITYSVRIGLRLWNRNVERFGRPGRVAIVQRGRRGLARDRLAPGLLGPVRHVQGHLAQDRLGATVPITSSR